MRKVWTPSIPWLAGALAIALILAGLLCIARPPAAVHAVPPEPTIFWGSVLVNGANVPSGTPITAFVYDTDGITPLACGSASSLMEAGVSVYFIAVNGDDDETPEKDGALEGETVYFWIGNPPERVLADQTGIWHSADSSRLDLTASHPTATPTSTPIPAEWRALLPLITKTNPTAGELHVVTFQAGLNGYAGASDTTLDAWSPSIPKGDEESLTLTTYDVREALLRFDLSAIPSTAVVIEARLELYASAQNGSANPRAGAFRVHRHWEESEASWLEAAAGIPWESAGCSGPRDREEAPISSSQLTRSNWWYTWDITPLARDWVRVPSSNAGLLLKTLDNPDWVDFSFDASEAGEGSHQPRLTMVFRSE